jgi:hypothetical protein
MHRNSRNLLLCLTLLLSTGNSGPATAASPLDAAVEKYYAGYPAEAIEMLKPIATAGDVDAQYLLGNIMYSLSTSDQFDAQNDPARWYRMAAAQDSAQANYALGAIHNNRWLQYHQAEDASLAQSYFKRALELGDPKARLALAKLQQSRETESLSYTDESFSSQREISKKSKRSEHPGKVSTPQKATLTEALSSFKSSGDPLTDARNLQNLLEQAGITNQSAAEATPNLSKLTQMLGNYESTDGLLADLIKLYEHIETASEISTAPGHN